MINYDDYPISIVSQILKIANQFYCKLNQAENMHGFSNMFRHDSFYELYSFMEPCFEQKYEDKVPFNDMTNEKWDYSAAELYNLFGAEIAIYQTMPFVTVRERIDKLFQKNRILHILLEYLRRYYEQIPDAQYRSHATDFDYNQILGFVNRLSPRIVNIWFYEGYFRLYGSNSGVTNNWLVGGELVLNQLPVTKDYIDRLHDAFIDNGFNFTISQVCTLNSILMLLTISGMDQRFNTYNEHPLMCDLSGDNESISNINDNLRNIDTGFTFDILSTLNEENLILVLNYANDVIDVFDIDNMVDNSIIDMIYNSASNNIDLTIDLSGDNSEWLKGVFGLGHKICIYMKSDDVYKQYKLFYINHLNIKNNTMSVIALSFDDYKANIVTTIMTRSSGYYANNPIIISNMTGYFDNGLHDKFSNISFHNVYTKSTSLINGHIWSYKQYCDLLESNFSIKTDVCMFLIYPRRFVEMPIFTDLTITNNDDDFKVLSENIEDYTLIKETSNIGIKNSFQYGDNFYDSYYTGRWNNNEQVIKISDKYIQKPGDTTKDVYANYQRSGYTLNGVADDGLRISTYTPDLITINGFNPNNFIVLNTNTKPFYEHKLNTTNDSANNEERTNLRYAFRYNTLNDLDELYNKTPKGDLQDFTISNYQNDVFIDGYKISVIINDIQYIFSEFNYNYDFTKRIMKINIKNESKLTDNEQEVPLNWK